VVGPVVGPAITTIRSESEHAHPGSWGFYADAVTAAPGDWLSRVEAWCDQPVPAKRLREGVLSRLGERLTWDGHVFCLCDPVTRVLTSPLADVPVLPWPRLPELVRWRYLTEVNRVDSLLDSGARSLLGGGSPDRSPMWRHVQRELGVVDVASVVFADRSGTWAFLELWRLTTPFTDDELDLLTRLQRAVTRALRSAVARTFAEPAGAPSSPGPAVLVLGPDLQLRTQTDAAAEALLRLNPPDEPMQPIPASAYNVGAALVAQEAGVPVGEPWSRVHLGDGRWVTVRASRLGEDVAVSIEPSTAAERADLVARSAGLSDRETEVLGALVAGLTSPEIAGRLYLSEHTVNDHVKAVLARTGARNRQQLLGRILGSGGGGGLTR
jgi:DNA-binding CsgD family transcriptional regulator